MLKKAASVNNKEFSEKMVDYLSPETKEAGKVWLLFSNRTLGIRTVVIFYNWFVFSHFYQVRKTTTFTLLLLSFHGFYDNGASYTRITSIRCMYL